MGNIIKFVIAIELGTETTAFGVVVPDLPGCFSAGDTLDKAVDNAREAIELWCQTVIEDGGNIPAAKTFAEHQANPDFVGWIWAVVECRQQPCKSFKAAVSHHDREVAELRADRELAVEYLKAAMESLDDPDDRAAGLLALRTVAEAYGGLGAAVPEDAVVSSDSKLGLARVGQETLPDKFFKRGKEIAKLADQGKRIPCERIIAFEDPEDLARHIPVQITREGNDE